MDRFAYYIKYNLKFLFPIIEFLSSVLISIRYKKSILAGVSKSEVVGTVSGCKSRIRVLSLSDTEAVKKFLHQTSEEHSKYFKPHEFDEESVRKAITSNSLLTYGLFVQGSLVAYALLRLSPNGVAYIGRIVDKKYTGKGIGKFLAKYLYWQASQAGFRPRSTVNKYNLASIRSHESVAMVKIVSNLPKNHLLLEFEVIINRPPDLSL